MNRSCYNGSLYFRRKFLISISLISLLTSNICLKISAYMHYQKTLEHSRLKNCYLHQTMGQQLISQIFYNKSWLCARIIFIVNILYCSWQRPWISLKPFSGLFHVTHRIYNSWKMADFALLFTWFNLKN